MKKLPLFLFILMTLASCGKDGGSSSVSPDSAATQRPELVEDYSPLGLSAKVFDSGGHTYAPMDFQSQELKIVFDASSKKVLGTGVIRFKLKKRGRPYFELQSSVRSARLNSNPVKAVSVSDPDGQLQSYWALDEDLSAGEIYEALIEYELPADRVTFTGGGVRFLTDMTDLSGKFFEYWGPVGFEEDGFAMKLYLEVMNATSEHSMFTNGEATKVNDSSWEIRFPDFFSKSSFYVHLTNNSQLSVKRFTYKGLEKEIPVEVYGVTSALVTSAVAELPKLFKELEEDYGPYPHKKFLAYLNDRSGGMEYVGATITSMASLDHELLHSWFARSVIPADGRSGWIDEAVASWRDYGYTRATTTLNRAPTNLANYSPFRKTTPSNSYVDGRALLAELDLELASIGGLKSQLRAFHKAYKNRVVTNEEFWYFLETQTGLDLSAFNERYALGETEELLPPPGSPLEIPSKHPTPLTREEVLRLR